MSFYDERPPTHSDDFTAFPQNNFNKCRLFFELARQFDGTRRRLDIFQRDDSPFSLGHNLLGDNQDILV
jgi:hypothetical protein